MDDESQRREPAVVVDAPLDGRRRVTIHGETVGSAVSEEELRQMLRRAGLTEPDASIDDPELVEWRGGGPDYWPAT